MTTVTISAAEYAELLRAKITLDILQEAYGRDETLGVDYIMKALFKKGGEAK